LLFRLSLHDALPISHVRFNNTLIKGSSVRVLYDIFRRDPSLFMLVTLVIIIAPFFFIGGPDKTSGPIFGAIWNLGHIIFFALVRSEEHTSELQSREK